MSRALLTPDEAASSLSISEKQLRALTAAGQIRYINIGLGKERERRRYDPVDIEQFLEAHKCLSTSAPVKRSTATTSAIVVHDFQARRTARQSAKQSAASKKSEIKPRPQPQNDQNP